MESCPETDADYFGFTDVHGFKDFLVYVLAYAPDLFPLEDWRSADSQMNLERAFSGLQYGLKLIESETGDSALTQKCRLLMDESYNLYRNGTHHAGQLKLEEMEALIKRIPSK